MIVKSDLEIAQEAALEPISSVASSLGIEQHDLIPYGTTKAKISLDAINRCGCQKDGKLILVTALNPTPAGEGKTTVSIGLADAIKLHGKKVCLALREPSLGPVFGIKGGAAGGGYSQVVPMEEINLHFTGDLHAITTANNLLCALIDNHIQQGNALGIDPRRVIFKRCMDMNDRQLRYMITGLGGSANGVPREEGFDITAASEVMAVFCLATSLADLKQKLGDILIGYTYDQQPVFARDLKAHGAMAVLLKDALCPNLVQTLAHTPCLMHGGPFANIAHGCNSIIATKTALKLADYTVTEAGFGADLGAEKFLDIKCRKAGIWPNCVVIVATVRALKSHGGVAKGDLSTPNPQAVSSGLPNLLKHIENIQKVFGLPTVVAINRFATDSEEEIQTIIQACQSLGVSAIPADVWAQGGQGGFELAKEVLRLADSSNSAPQFSYALDEPLEQKIQHVVQKIYGGSEVSFSPEAKRQMALLEQHGFDQLPVCIAKTQYSFSDDAAKIGRPENFTFHIREVKVSHGAGFVVALAGKIMTMPGLGKTPAANEIDIDSHGNTVGLF